MYFTTSDYNMLTSETHDKNISKKKLVNKSDVPGSINNSNLDEKIATLAANTELKINQG